MNTFAERDELTELAVLVPGWQAEALEEAAHRQGLTAGQLLRQMLNRFLVERTGAADEQARVPVLLLDCILDQLKH